MKILNIGCGKDTYGTERIDFIKTPSTTKVYDVENGLPYSDNEFDEVYSEHLLEHIRNPYNLILEMKRVCKKNGKIKIITDNTGYLLFHIFIKNKNDYHGNYNRKMQLNGKFINKDMHYMLYSQEHLRNLFNAARIKIIKIGLSYDRKVTSFKSKTIHKILNFFVGDRLSMPCVEIVGNKK